LSAALILQQNLQEKYQQMKQNSSFRPWLIWALGAGFFLTEYFARVSPSVMLPDLMRSFNADALALGTLSACFYLAYIPMQLPVGMLVDKFGPHKLLTIMAFLCGLSCYLFGVAHVMWLGQLGRLLMGFSASFAFVGTLKLASMWFPARRFGLLAGLTQGLGMLGAVIGEAPTAVAVHHIGWRNTMYIMAVVIIVLAVFIGIIVRDKPATPTASIKPENKVGIWHGLILVLKNSRSWVNAGYIGLLYAPSAAFAELWGVNFLTQTYHWPRTLAGAAIGTIFIGWTIGGPATGWISDRIGRRKPLLMFSAVCGMLFMGSVIYIPHLSVITVFALLFLYGMTNTGVAISYAVASEINAPQINGTSMAFANMASVLIGALFQPIIGYILDKLWTGHMQHGIRVYSSSNYHWALLALPICSLLSFVFAWFVKETHCRNVA
jgi:MFS family permease